MELNQLLKKLLESGILENQELGVVLLGAPDVSMEEKQIYIDKFLKDYTDGKVDFFKPEHKHLFENWVALYELTIKDSIKNRVKKID